MPAELGESGWRQVGALVVNGATNTVAALRWVPARCDVQRCGTDGLAYHVPEASHPFVAAVLQRTCDRAQEFPVYLFHPTAHYALGAYQVVAWAPPVATLRPVAASVKGTKVPQPVVANPPPPSSSSATSILDVLRAWGVDVVDDGVSFPLGDDDRYVPDALLHGILSPAAVAWCGEWSRLGPSCLLQAFAEYPPATAFARARAVVGRYHYPVLFLFGVPCGTAADAQRNAGLQAILFHPGRAETSRVHFRWTPGAQLVIGEIGDAV